MAAITLIVGGVLGWIAAAIAMVAGGLFTTALLIFFATSLAYAAITLTAVALRPTGSA